MHIHQQICGKKHPKTYHCFETPVSRSVTLLLYSPSEIEPKSVTDTHTTHRHKADKQANRRTGAQAHRRTHRQADRPAYRQDTQAHRQARIQTDRQAGTGV